MVEAVQAHENVHVTEYESSYNNTFSNVKSGTEALTTPFQCGDTIAAAKQRMQSAATAVFNNGNTTASNATRQFQIRTLKRTPRNMLSSIRS